jgi:acyl-CoA oxidase
MAARAATKEVLPDDIHWAMFVPNIRSTCDDAQRGHWLPRVDSGEVVGCYAQTEMGHGSNVRGLQTTATYLPETDEFEVSRGRCHEAILTRPCILY